MDYFPMFVYSKPRRFGVLMELVFLSAKRKKYQAAEGKHHIESVPHPVFLDIGQW